MLTAVSESGGPRGEIERSGHDIERPRRELELPSLHRSIPPWELELPPQRALVMAEAVVLEQESAETRIDSDDAYDETPPDWSRLIGRLRGREVTLAALALIVASLIWKATFLSHYYFRQDDFQVLDAALKSGMSVKYLTYIGSGHLFPGVDAIVWVLARVALYNWGVAAGVIMLMITAASLAAWRLLRTLFGDRPAILIPLALYVLSPLAFPNYSWWISAVEAVPLQIVIFAALTAHVHYVRTGMYRHAVAAAGWLVVGFLFFEKSAVIPVLLFAVTAWFMIRGPLLAATRIAAVRYWRAWLLYGTLVAAYTSLLLSALHTSTVQPSAPASFSMVRTFVSELVQKTLLPGLLGGPWHWYHTAHAGYAYSSPPRVLTWASMTVAAVIVVGSILTRRRAWRAWAILAGWVAVADMLPVIVGRLQAPGAAEIFSMETRYVADAPAVLAVVVGLACWQVTDPQDMDGRSRPERPREFFGARWRAVAIGLVAVFAVGSFWSVQRFQSETAGAADADRAYVTNANTALSEAPAGTTIVDRQVPSTMMLGLFKSSANTSVVLGPMISRGGAVSWTSEPSGNVGHLMIFGTDGRLYPASISGTTTLPLRGQQGCTTATKTRLVLPFEAPASAYARILRLAYLGSPSAAGQRITVTYGSSTYDLQLRSGLNNAYFPVRGSADAVVVQDQYGVGLCVDNAVAGYFVPALGGGIPARPGSRAIAGPLGKVLRRP